MAVGPVAAGVFVESGSVELGFRIGSRLVAVGPARVGEVAALQPPCALTSSASPIPRMTGARMESALARWLARTSTQEILGAAVLAAEHALAGEADLTAAVLTSLQVADIGGLG